ncbi:hypothetical protein OSB04_003047 [Centaurea solstitialis]|uniref:Uncharacterized protein n=1 Tax=Centaurea solstitialis TaxID=347529 RepID=A0AA38WVJ6_9ASTR|nr:hypothetical protein OSB04_003047 [Centaurea solstitialis]
MGFLKSNKQGILKSSLMGLDLKSILGGFERKGRASFLSQTSIIVALISPNSIVTHLSQTSIVDLSQTSIVAHLSQTSIIVALISPWFSLLLSTRTSTFCWNPSVELLEWFNDVVRVVVFIVVSLWIIMVKRQRDRRQIRHFSSNVNRSSILHRYVYESDTVYIAN